MGFVAGDDGVCVGKLRRAGAIVLAVTNMPEFSFGIECNNLLTGTTCNPYNTNFTSGGSSGGEVNMGNVLNMVEVVTCLCRVRY